MDSRVPGVTVTAAWIRCGILGGIVACTAYPLLAFAPLPKLLTVTLAALFGPALGLASIGLCRFVELHKPSWSAQAGTSSNLIASGLISAMLLVQLAVKLRPETETITAGVPGVWLGLDVAWDVFLSVGTFCFALAALSHPRLGILFGLPGILVATALLSLNLLTFPVPPGEAGLVDLGPAVGLWYLAVTLRIWSSRGWVQEQIGI